MAKKKKRFPSSKARFCTEELKTKPMIDYILSQKENLMIIQGVRRDESLSRSKMEKECRFFKYYLEPYGVDKKGKDKYFTYRKKEVFNWIKTYSDDILRPVFDWSAQEVIDYILQNNQQPNPLYYKGFSRVGCMPCIMCRKSEISQMAKELPEYSERLINAEAEVGRTFFSPDDMPARIRKYRDPKSGKKITTASEMIQYASGDPGQTEMYEENDKRCMSFYGLCE